MSMFDIEGISFITDVPGNKGERFNQVWIEVSSHKAHWWSKTTHTYDVTAEVYEYNGERVEMPLTFCDMETGPEIHWRALPVHGTRKELARNLSTREEAEAVREQYLAENGEQGE